MKRWVAGLTLMVGLVALLTAQHNIFYHGVPIRVGLLHSKAGDMANSEKSLIDAEVSRWRRLTRREGCWVTASNG